MRFFEFKVDSNTGWHILFYTLLTTVHSAWRKIIIVECGYYPVSTMVIHLQIMSLSLSVDEKQKK